MNFAPARTITTWFVIVGLFFCSAAAAVSQEQGRANEPSTQLEDVVVLGLPLDQQVERFVDEITAPPAGRNPARWRSGSRICVGVINLQREPAQAISDRISQVALELGLDVGVPGCDPNVIIIATEDGRALAGALIARSPNAFRPDYAGGAGSRRELELFESADRPVRWWHVALPVDAETGFPAVRLPGEERPTYVRGAGRIGTLVRNYLLRAYVIIDVDEVSELSLRQLADFVAMTVFAQIDPNADVGDQPTILNAFKDDGPESMTDWDLAYLRALYEVEMNLRSPAAQAGAIAGQMLRIQRQDTQRQDTDVTETAD